MPSLSALATLLAFSDVILGSPVDVQKRKPFSLGQVERKKFVKHGPTQMAKDLRKHGVAVPEAISIAAAAGPNGSAPAVPGDQYDSLYLTPVTVGSSTLQLDFDTGSSDLWVFSSLQASSQLTGHDYYKVDASKKVAGATWKISYGDGSGASGTVYADKVVVGGVTATSQAVEAATSVSAAFQRDTDTDGLLGLAFSSLNTIKPTPSKTWFDTIKGNLPSPIFAVTLKYHAAGTYDFGFIDKSKYTGDITYVNVDNSDGFWGFTATGYAVGTGAEVKTSIPAIGDTGTTLLYLPTAIVKAYYAKVSGAKLDSTNAGGWVFPCSATLPDFTATIGGAKQVVPGKYINYAPLETGSTTCFGGIQVNDGLPFSIFGDIFLKSKYVVHELSATPRLGFAQQAGV
ncbi:Asp-domain-containing protein [Aaosphaeria arxii CBS 175.79]|uniref:Asp-domain-containing protein n=1 Tax=Aaosphaeria arxii CBS 175.79 TaxID=1450172 RepID=A0A6A5XDL5_9PLEO|nr:Asp-domain-containing protein [Aaosphaeria arxii CBS 175.79]KAF2010963.1 Asp-domain-containing protein [Aaosphaeria arxii CBS 175.79]